MSNIQICNYNERRVRVVIIDGFELWFVAQDVFDILDIVWKRSDSLNNIPDRWKMKVSQAVSNSGSVEIPSDLQDSTWLLHEAGVYKIAFRSNKLEAERFTHWVAEEVLPSIRRTGKYESSSISGLEINKLLGTLSGLVEKVEQLTLASKRLDDINYASSKHPGFRNIIEGELDVLDVINNKGYTVKTYCIARGVNLTIDKAIQMGQIASASYKLDKKVEPSKYGSRAIYYGNDVKYLDEAFDKVTSI